MTAFVVWVRCLKLGRNEYFGPYDSHGEAESARRAFLSAAPPGMAEASVELLSSSSYLDDKVIQMLRHA